MNSRNLVGLKRVLGVIAIGGVAAITMGTPALAQAAYAEQCLASIEKPAGENGQQVVGLCIEALKLDPNSATLIYALARTLNGMQQYERAIELYTNLAGRGFAPAQTALGIAYYNGEGVAQDHAAAANWFRQAAEKGYASAQNNLGLLYLNGQGVEKSPVDAMRWFTAAAGQGHEGARANALALYERYSETAVEMSDELTLEMAALAAQIEQVEQRLKGLEAIKAGDYGAAVELLRTPAEAGDVQSQHYLGVLFLVGGNGAVRDMIQAKAWFERAAAQGDEESVKALAQMDTTEKEMGMPLSEGWRLEDISAGTDALRAKDYQRAIELLSPHTAYLEPAVMFVIGSVYLMPAGEALGITPDRDEAIRWLRMAAEGGYGDAAKRLESLGVN